MAAKIISFTPAPSSGDALDTTTLVERALEGAHWAQGELFKRYAPQTLSMLTRLLGSTAEAEDAIQDAFIEAFRDLKLLRDRQRFEAWLRRIAVRQANRRFRRRRILSFVGLDSIARDATLEKLADENASPEARAELSMLQNALEKIPPIPRSAWLLRHVDGFELTEVADALSLSLSTVKRKLLDANRIIQRLTDTTYGESP